MICLKCDREMEPAKANFNYLKHRATQEVLTCPVCKTVYVPEKLALGKMREMETMLEDK